MLFGWTSGIAFAHPVVVQVGLVGLHCESTVFILTKKLVTKLAKVMNR
jgi:hypothetical protein